MSRFDRLTEMEAYKRVPVYAQRITPTTIDIMNVIYRSERLVMEQIALILAGHAGTFGSKADAERWLKQSVADKRREAVIKEIRRLPKAQREYFIRHMTSPPLTGRMNNRAAMNAIIDIHGVRAGFAVDALTTGVLSGVVADGMNRQMFALQKGLGAGWDVAQPNQTQIETVLKRAYNSSSSMVITDRWAKEIKERLASGILSGQDLKSLTKSISEVSDGEIWQVKRMVRTELTWSAGEAEIETLKDAELESYRYLATLDEKTCDDCGGVDMQTFLISERVVGENMPPMHPNCRCTVTAVITNQHLKELKRKHRDPSTGKNSYVPADTSYNDWAKKHLKPKVKNE